MFSTRTTAFMLLILAALGASVPQSSAQAAAPPVTDTSAAGELAYWNLVKDSDDPADLAHYLEAFPNGMFAAPAGQRYQALTGKAFEAGSAVTPPATEASSTPTAEPEPVVTKKASASGKKVKQKSASKKSVSRKANVTKVKKSRSAEAKKQATRSAKIAAKPVKKKRKAVAASSAAKPKTSCSGSYSSTCAPAKKKKTILIDASKSGNGGGWN